MEQEVGTSHERGDDALKIIRHEKLVLGLQTRNSWDVQIHTLKRYKTKLVAKGYIKTYGIDYLECFFALVANINTVRSYYP